MTTQLVASEITLKLDILNKQLLQPWTIENEKLHKEFSFGNFITAFSFMTRVAIYAEKANHHPEWFNVYKTVIVDLTTHDAGGISEKDFALAEKIETTSAA